MALRSPLTRKRLAYTGFIVASLAIGAAWWTLSKPPAPTFQTVVAERGDIITSITASGSLQAVGTVEVGSEVSGLIKELHADFNTPVKQGQVLARIDPSTFESRTLQGEAQLAIAQAQLDQAKAELREAERDFETKRKLSTSGWYSARGTETAEAALARARASVKLSEANLLQARANLNQARIDLSRTYIRAPVDGIVISRAINIGQTVAASFQTPTLFTIAEDLAEMQVEAAVDEADIGSVAPGQRAEFTVDAYPDRIFEGEVKELRLASGEADADKATASSGVVTYTVIITAPNKDGKLLPNMTANATIFLGEVRDVLKLPVMALSYKPAAIAAREARNMPPGGGFGPPGMGGRRAAGNAANAAAQTPAPGMENLPKGQRGTVWVLGPKGQPEQKPVAIGVRTDEEISVVGGPLKAGDKVILSESTPS